MGPGPERFVVFAAMRNEGPFIVEWVCWYRMLGFEVIVGINDCTDRSPDLLAALAGAGWLTLFEHSPPDGVPPKTSAYRALRRQPALAGADWLLICDVDEFLVLHRGDGIAGYLDDIGRNHMGVAFHWRCFGTGGWKRWRDGLTHRQFRRCGPAADPVNVFVKTMFRAPERFRHLSDHAPHGFDGAWGSGTAQFVSSSGRPLERFHREPPPVRFTTVAEIDHSGAQMNHYVLRSVESYGLKKGRPSASAFRDRYTDAFFARRDRNGQRDLSALAWSARFEPVHQAALAVPGVRRLHHLCCADYVAQLAALAGRAPQDDPRWHHHLEAAGPA